jgi:hypothetical protein
MLLSFDRQAFLDGFGFRFATSSTLEMRGGSRYRAAAVETMFEGTLEVSVGGTATLEVDGNARFLEGSHTTLTGSLLLQNVNTVVSTGATFSGGGALINAEGGALFLQDGVSSADLGVSIVNQGRLAVGGPGLGQVGGADFEQTANGEWDLTIGGVGVTGFDRLTLTGIAVLDGTLDLSLFGGFTPTEGQLYSILSAGTGVSGQFASVLQPAGMPAGLRFNVVYSPTLVQLRVVSAPMFSADFDADGDVDADDLAQWRGDYGANGDSDADLDGDSDGADFLAWQRQLGSGLPAQALTSAIPEPSSICLTVAGLIAALRGRRRFVLKLPITRL